MKTIKQDKMNNETLRNIYKNYNNTVLSNEVLENFNTEVKEEKNVTVRVAPIYREEGGVCTETVKVTYKDIEYTVLRNSLSVSHQNKIPIGRWGRIRVKLSTLKLKE